jgi:hypothetical protein
MASKVITLSTATPWLGREHESCGHPRESVRIVRYRTKQKEGSLGTISPTRLRSVWPLSIQP